MYRPFRLLFALVVVSHGDPTAFDDDYRPADDPVSTTNSTPAPRPVPAPDVPRTVRRAVDAGAQAHSRSRRFPLRLRLEGFGALQKGELPMRLDGRDLLLLHWGSLVHVRLRLRLLRSLSYLPQSAEDDSVQRRRLRPEERTRRARPLTTTKRTTAPGEIDCSRRSRDVSDSTSRAASSFSAVVSFSSYLLSRARCATRCTTNASNARSSSPATRTAHVPRTQTNS